MEFRRIHDLPPYVFATIDELKREPRRDGRDVIDLGFGNPDIPSPAIAVEKLAEAARKPPQPPLLAPAAASRKLREAVAELYERTFGVSSTPRPRCRQHDRRQGGLQPPDVGAARAGRRAVVPSPSYPIHI